MNYYAEAIGIVANTRFDQAEKLLIEIAKYNPAVVVKAFKSISPPTWQDEAIPLLKDGKKIEAIKKCREITGWGLKEAKEACEALKL